MVETRRTSSNPGSNNTDGGRTTNEETLATDEAPRGPIIGTLGGVQLDGTQLLAILQGFMETGREQAQAVTQALERVVQPPPAPQQQEGTIESFRKLRPPEFHGIEGLNAADDWLEETERLMQVARLAADLRVEAAGLQMKDVAKIWFRNEPRLNTPGVQWTVFAQAFKEQYHPETDVHEMEKQFMRLEQGNKTVDEYQAEFNRLSHFAEAMVRDPVDRARRFRMGLHWELQSQITHDPRAIYQQVLSDARSAEKRLAMRPKRVTDLLGGYGSHQGPAKRHNTQQDNYQAPRVQQHRLQQQYRQPQQFQMQPLVRTVQFQRRPAPTCYYCHKVGHIAKECRKMNKLCMRCGSAQHQVKDCNVAPPLADQRQMLPAVHGEHQVRGKLLP